MHMHYFYQTNCFIFKMLTVSKREKMKKVGFRQIKNLMLLKTVPQDPWAHGFKLGLLKRVSDRTSVIRGVPGGLVSAFGAWQSCDKFSALPLVSLRLQMWSFSLRLPNLARMIKHEIMYKYIQHQACRGCSVNAYQLFLSEVS